MPERPVVLVAAEPVVQRLVQSALDSRGFRVSGTTQPQLGSAVIVDLHPDVVVLDASLSRQEAFAALRRMSAGDPVPIIVTSASATPTAARDLLDAGADDFLGRPFDPLELAARVRSLVRRQGPRLATGRRRIGSAIVDLDRRVVHVDGHSTSLARSDWRLLVRLLQGRGDVVSHDELLRAAFGWEAVGDIAPLQAAIGRLRRKLGAAPGDAGPIRTVRGFGYAVAARST